MITFSKVRRATAAAIGFAAAAVLWVGFKPAESFEADAAAVATSEEEAIAKAQAIYFESYRKGDLDGVMSLWAADAEYVTESGDVLQGAEAIRSLCSDSFRELPGYIIRVKNRRLRFVRPDVAIEDGTMELVAPTGEIDPTMYTSVWVKTAGKWRLASMRDIPCERPAPPTGGIEELAWMIGEWKAEEGSRVVDMSVQWERKGTFLIQTFRLRHGSGAEEITVSQRIGWDGSAGALRSWAFDSLGGFCEGAWQRAGNTWSARLNGVMPDGRPASSRDSWRLVDERTISWNSTERVVNGVVQPEVYAKFVRKPAAK